MNDRPPIPDPMKRAIRQRCSFGCVICGLPIYEYDHIFGYKKETGHIVEEITLLCDHHHKLKTNKLIPLETIIQSNSDPVNKRTNHSKPMSLDYFHGDTCEIEVGDNSFNAHRSLNNLIYAICIDDIPVLGFRFEGNNLLLTIYVFDQNNNPLVIIYDNELVYSTKTWDIEFEGNTLSIRRSLGDFIFQASFEPPSKIHVTRGVFFLNGASVQVSEKWVETSGGIRVSGSTTVFTSGGIIVGENRLGLQGITGDTGGHRLPINQSNIYTIANFPYPIVAPFVQQNKPLA